MASMSNKMEEMTYGKRLEDCGMGAAAALAVPVAGLSGLAAAGLTLILVLAMFGVGPARLSQTSLWGLLTSELMLYQSPSLPRRLA